ncbi:MAG: dephospho-CoA kinase [Chthoniobacterales bacterium]|nr:dephospho-CoA kinase [Chthoniobacterales bacterium]
MNPKPIIGIAGGIGSGKSTVARLFAELGCLVISSDDQVRDAYEQPDVKETLTHWWGKSIFRDDGAINRRAIAEKIFADPDERKRLEGLLHPRVKQMRDAVMSGKKDDARVPAFIWDTPLLFETGLNVECDAVVFVDAPTDIRNSRLRSNRGWGESELLLREKSQLPLDKKRQMSEYVISNAADAGETSEPNAVKSAGLEELRGQVRDVLSRILERTASRLFE